MKAIKLITAFTLTSLITISQSSLGEQNSSAKQTSSTTTQNTIPKAKITKDKDLSVADLKKDVRHEREFKDALLTDIQFSPDDDPAHKPENGYSSSSSSTPAQKNNARK